MSCIAIIPARSGSKGVINKNIRDLKGKPLMAYTIEAAVASELFDCVHVSTDSEEYSKLAIKHGADVPFLRSDEFARDYSSTWDVIRYVLDEYDKLGIHFDEIAVLQPTSPLRDEEDIIAAYQIFKEKSANAVVSVCENEHCPLMSDVILPDGNMKGFVKKCYRDIPRQELPTYYRVNGAIYIIKKECLKYIEEIYDRNCYAYIMDSKKSVDIDSEIDFKLAEFILSVQNEEG